MRCFIRITVLAAGTLATLFFHNSSRVASGVVRWRYAHIKQRILMTAGARSSFFGETSLEGLETLCGSLGDELRIRAIRLALFRCPPTDETGVSGRPARLALRVGMDTIIF